MDQFDAVAGTFREPASPCCLVYLCSYGHFKLLWEAFIGVNQDHVPPLVQLSGVPTSAGSFMALKRAALPLFCQPSQAVGARVLLCVAEAGGSRMPHSPVADRMGPRALARAPRLRRIPMTRPFWLAEPVWRARISAGVLLGQGIVLWEVFPHTHLPSFHFSVVAQATFISPPPR